MAIDEAIRSRVAACAAQEQPADPWVWTNANVLAVCAAPGWAEAWASAVAAEVPDPGRDPGVITDGMILSSVQSVVGVPE